MTLGRCFNEQLSSKTAGVREDVNGASPCADGAPGGRNAAMVPDSRSPLFNAAKEVDLGS